MRLILATATLVFLLSTAYSQNFTFSCPGISGKTSDSVSYNKGSIIMTFTADTKQDLLSFLRSSLIINADRSTTTFETFAGDSANRATKKLTDLLAPMDAGQPNGRVKISLLPPNNSFTAVIKCGGTKADTIPFTFIATSGNNPANSPKAGPSNSKLPYGHTNFITADMIKSIQTSSTCNLCDDRMRIVIDSKKERVYSTDYIVTFDPLLKKDAYTICKHIFQDSADKKIERYKKVGAKWFAPGVGSQIRFEVVNQPLTEIRRVTVDAIDVFNNGSTQFQGIINSQVNTQIISRLNPSTTPSGNPPDTTASQNAMEKEDSVRELTPQEKLQMLHSQLVDYVSVFRLSSCTIDEHARNLPKIVSNVNAGFGTTAAGVVSLTQQLKFKFADSTKLINILDEIGNLLGILKDVKPLAFTTFRAKNRDYLNIKAFDGNNVEISNENIRLSGGMKIDFSAGFVLSGLRDFNYSLRNASFRYLPTNAPNDSTQYFRDTTGNVIIQEDNGNNEVGVAILTHFYPRISSHYNIGGTLGLMTSTNLNLRLMLGGSMMISSLFGSNNRVSFSGGVVWGKVNRLSEQYKEYVDSPRTINGLPEFYSSAAAPQPILRNEHSWFFAMTMNFGGN